MVEQHAHGFSEAIGTLRTKMVHDLIEHAMVVLVGVGHFGFVLFAKTSKPIWPAPAIPDLELQNSWYTGRGTSFPHLGTSFPHLGASFPHLGTSFPHLGMSFPHLGTSFPRLG